MVKWHSDWLVAVPARAEVDAYLATRQNPAFLAALHSRLQLPAQEAMICGTRHNAPLLNALVFYVGIQVCPFRITGLQPCIMQTVSLWQVGVLIYAMGGQ